MIPFKKYSIQDLGKKLNLQKKDVFENRKHVRIAVIDDEEFKPLEGLLSEGYQVAYIGNYTEMRALRGYQIVICDVDKVGKNKNSDEHGAAVIQEIKRVFPEKKVIVFSGLTRQIKKLRLAEDRADYFLPKGTQINIWNQTLDEIIEECIDPIAVWEAAKIQLEEKKIPTKQIVELENKYVRSVLKGRPDVLKGFAKEELNDFTKSVASGLVTSAIWALLA